MKADSVFIQKPAKINRIELLIGIALATTAIILFNVYPEAVGLVPAEEAWLFPLLDPNFATHIPWLTASWGMEIALKLLVLVEGRWRWTSRLFEFLLSLFGVYVAYRILTGGPITTFAPLDWPILLGLWIAIIVGSISAAVQGVRLLVGRPANVEKATPSHLA